MMTFENTYTVYGKYCPRAQSRQGGTYGLESRLSSPFLSWRLSLVLFSAVVCMINPSGGNIGETEEDSSVCVCTNFVKMQNPRAL
jgi:hypothetical protein